MLDFVFASDVSSVCGSFFMRFILITIRMQHSHGTGSLAFYHLRRFCCVSLRIFVVHTILHALNQTFLSAFGRYFHMLLLSDTSFVLLWFFWHDNDFYFATLFLDGRLYIVQTFDVWFVFGRKKELFFNVSTRRTLKSNEIKFKGRLEQTQSDCIWLSAVCFNWISHTAT